MSSRSLGTFFSGCDGPQWSAKEAELQAKGYRPSAPGTQDTLAPGEYNAVLVMGKGYGEYEVYVCDLPDNPA